MTHRGQRSERARKRRIARRYVLATSYHDTELAETVSRVNVHYAERIGKTVFPVFVECGEVLIDNRARGTFQQIMSMGVKA